jgi:type I restriction enzyme, S subunit
MSWMDGDAPEGWMIRPLGEVATVVGGGTPKTGVPGNFSDEAGHPWITPADLTGYAEKYISRGRRFLTDQGLASSSAKVVPAGTVLFSSRAPIGYVAIAAKPITTNQGFRSFVPSEHIDSEYLFYVLRFLKPLAEQLASGTTFAEISGSTAARIPVAYPPLDQQRTIARALDKADHVGRSASAHLAAASRAIDRFRQVILSAACSGRLTADWRDQQPERAAPVPAMAQGAPASRRGRLWGGGSVPELTDEERGSIPASWAWLKVSQLGSSAEATVQIGPMSMRSAEFAARGVPVLNVGSVQDGYIDPVKRNFLPAGRAEGFERYRVREGDVLFTRSGTVGRCAVVPAEHDRSLMTFHLLRVRTEPAICLAQYLWFAFNGSPSIHRQRDEGQIGSTRGGFNTALLAGIDVPLPPIHEQGEIVRRVEQLLAVAENLKRRITSTSKRVNRSSQAVLAKAFRGELMSVNGGDS